MGRNRKKAKVPENLGQGQITISKQKNMNKIVLSKRGMKIHVFSLFRHMYWICLEKLNLIFLAFKSLILLLRPIVPTFLCHFPKKINLDYYLEIYSQLPNSVNLHISSISLVALILKKPLAPIFEFIFA